MSMPQITIRKDNQATRCEICHQADLFDPATEQCQRCSQLMLPSVTNLTAVRNIGRERLAIISKWLRLSYCGSAGIVIFYVVGGLLLTMLAKLLSPTQDFINYFAGPYKSFLSFSYYFFLIALISTAFSVFVYIVYWNDLKLSGKLDNLNSNKQQPGYNYATPLAYGFVYGFGSGFLLTSLLLFFEVYTEGKLALYYRIGLVEIVMLVIGYSIMWSFFGAMTGLFVGCIKSFWQEHRLRQLRDTINENGA